MSAKVSNSYVLAHYAFELPGRCLGGGLCAERKLHSEF